MKHGRDCRLEDKLADTWIGASTGLRQQTRSEEAPTALEQGLLSTQTHADRDRQLALCSIETASAASRMAVHSGHVLPVDFETAASLIPATFS